MTEFESNSDSGPSWMEEAHRRASASEDSSWTVWNGGAVTPRAELSAAAVAAVIGFAWLTSRGAIGVSSNPWQGLMLDGAYPVPLLAGAITSAMAWFDPPVGIILLNVLTRLLGAATCAGVTAITVNAVRRVGSVGDAWICGLLAGVVFVLSQGVTSAFTGAWPGALTVTSAVWGLAALSRAVQSRSRCALWLTIGAGLCGVAAVGHAFFGWLVIPLFGVMFSAWRHKTLRVRGSLSALFVWVATLALPIVNALAIQGRQPSLFLGRVLRAPYPAVAEQAPEWNVFLQIGNQFHPLVWILALAAVVIVFQRHARAGVIAPLMIFVVAGPLAPFLMNQYDSGAFPRDELALEVTAIAGFAIVFGLGLAASMQVVFRRSHSIGYRVAMAMLVLAIVALHQWDAAPNRRSDLSRAFAQAVLDGCPSNSILIVQDGSIAGMLNAAQYGYDYRRDVRVVPAGVLMRPAARQHYQHVHPDGIHIDTAYDTQQHAANWQRERPLITNTLLNSDFDSSDRRSALDDLILWEFVRDNFGARPIAFAGIDADWIHARAAINGLVQVYPRIAAPSTESMEAWLALKTTDGLQARDPELANAFTRILLSLSATRRAQNQGEDAKRLAVLATQCAKDEPRAWMALARAAARSGSREDAQVYSNIGLRIGGGDKDESDAVLQRDFDAYDLVSKYRIDLDGEPDDPDGKFRRREMVADLWLVDEIAVIAELMEQELALEPTAARNLYELAAAEAQLGDLAAARRHLLSAIDLAPEDVEGHLEKDGRFVLLQLDHLPSPHQTAL